jgi:Tol biopolymer transport system component
MTKLPAFSIPLVLLSLFVFSGCGESPVGTILVDDGSLTQITFFESDPDLRNFSDPAWSPDGSQIAFGAEGPHGLVIWVMPATGGQPTEIDTAWGYAPDWSPDGTRIAFTGWMEIFTHAAAPGYGPSVRVPVDILDNASDPSWSPDGTRLAFTSWTNGSFDLWVVSARGGAPLHLTDHPANDCMPAWSPDGRWIAFAAFRAGNYDIWLHSTVDTTEMRITDGPEDDLNPTWSPDSRWIAFVSAGPNEGAEDWEVRAVPARGGEVRTIVTGAYQPDWSLDGSRIVFASRRDGNTNLWTVEVELRYEE